MIGAILGDMIGAPYEFDMGYKTKDFPLFIRTSMFTDDSVMTVAVAEALMDTMGKSDGEIRQAVADSMRKWGPRYPDAGYGGRFHRWLYARNPAPYGSYGNGSAMRVSAAGWLYDTLEETRRVARLTAEVTHNHPEGIKGAESTASAIWLARHGYGKGEIRDYIVKEFGYDLSRTCDEIRPGYHHVESCQQTVPEAITAFLEGESFEDVIRTAVSLGGDCDTLTCIAGGIAEAYYGVPEEMEAEGRRRLPEDLLAVLDRFTATVKPGGSPLKKAVDICRRDRTRPNLLRLLYLLRDSMVWIPCTAIMSGPDEDALVQALREAEASGGLETMVGQTFASHDPVRLKPDILRQGEEYYFPVFTDEDEMGEYGEHFSKVEEHFLNAVCLARNNEKKVAGIVINAITGPFVIPAELFGLIEDMASAPEAGEDGGAEGSERPAEKGE